MNFCRKLDILGQDIGFEENESTKFKTWQGATLTIIVITICSVIGFMFGKDIYERKIANVRYSKDMLTSGVIEVNKNPYMFGLTGRNGKFISNPQDYFDVYEDVYISDESLKITYKRNPMIQNCNSTTILMFNNYFKESTPCEGGGCYCSDPQANRTFQNMFGNPQSTFINIVFLPCDKTKRTCAKDLEFVLSNFFISSLTLNSYVNSDNYEDPLFYFVQSIGYQFSTDFYKRIYIAVTNNTFISDNGWLLENLVSVNYAQISEIKIDMLTYSKGNTPIGAFTFHSPRLVDKINRSYMKVQDLAAKIGGIINAMFIIVNILSFNYLRFLYIGNLYDLTTKHFQTSQKKSSILDSSSTPVKTNNYLNPNTKSSKENEDMKIIKEKIFKLDKMNVKVDENKQAQIKQLAKPDHASQNIETDDVVFNFWRYLKSYFTKGNYYKVIDERIKLTKDKMSIITLSKAMNYFYLNESIYINK